MATRTPSDWYILYEGRWTESVCFLGAGRWKFCSTDDLSCTSLTDTFSTRRLIEWVCDRDGEDQEISGRLRRSSPEVESSLEQQHLGPRGVRLLKISEHVGATLCNRQLLAISKGEWPPAPRIHAITGVERRSVWRGVSHAVYAAHTSRGPAYVYPPDYSNVAKVVLKTAASTDEGWSIRLTAKQVREMDGLKTQYEQLSPPGRN